MDEEKNTNKFNYEYEGTNLEWGVDCFNCKHKNECGTYTVRVKDSIEHEETDEYTNGEVSVLRYFFAKFCNNYDSEDDNE